MRQEILQIKSFYLLYENIPQMSPMNWLLLFIWFTATFVIVKSKIFYL